MAVKVRYEKEAGKILAGNIVKGGGFGSHCNEVTDDAIIAVMNYIVDMKMTGDGSEIIEYNRPVLKYGMKKYKVEIHITPID